MGQQPFDDVRMRGFRRRASVVSVHVLIDARVAPLAAEPVPVVSAAGRVLAQSVVSPVDVPGFERSAMDGFALRAADTSSPFALELVGESRPGRPFAGTVGPAQAVRITTGAPIPDGTDAVLIAEHAQVDGDRVRGGEPVPAGKHVVRVGEDVRRGREVLSAGRVLRPQDLGLLASIGVASVPVVRRPRVALLVTGDELLPPGSVPSGCRIVDSNSPMLAALVARDGGECGPVRYLPDQFEAIRQSLAECDADLILISGGTSVGVEDHAPRVVAELGELPVHGIAVRPASPAGVGFVRDVPVFLLPGNPVACLCAYDLFAGRAVRRLGRLAVEMPYRSVTLPLAAGVASVAGRVDCLRVRIAEGRAVPLGSGGASALSSTVAADGFVLVEAGRESLAAGEVVMVWVYG